jgi:hypothetical protein
VHRHFAEAGRAKTCEETATHLTEQQASTHPWLRRNEMTGTESRTESAKVFQNLRGLCRLSSRGVLAFVPQGNTRPNSANRPGPSPPISTSLLCAFVLFIGSVVVHAARTDHRESATRLTKGGGDETLGPRNPRKERNPRKKTNRLIFFRGFRSFRGLRVPNIIRAPNALHPYPEPSQCHRSEVDDDPHLRLKESAVPPSALG